jgi:SNF2 family DNA or RNA helicase
LADEMGMGKTIMCLGLIATDLEAAKPVHDRKHAIPGGTLIVCPLSVLSQWRDEVSTRLSTSVSVYYGTDRSKNSFVQGRQRPHIVITTYGVCVNESRIRIGDRFCTPPLEEIFAHPVEQVWSKEGLFSIEWDRVILDVRVHN